MAERVTDERRDAGGEARALEVPHRPPRVLRIALGHHDPPLRADRQREPDRRVAVSGAQLKDAAGPDRPGELVEDAADEGADDREAVPLGVGFHRPENGVALALDFEKVSVDAGVGDRERVAHDDPPGAECPPPTRSGQIFERTASGETFIDRMPVPDLLLSAAPAKADDLPARHRVE